MHRILALLLEKQELPSTADIEAYGTNVASFAIALTATKRPDRRRS